MLTREHLRLSQDSAHTDRHRRTQARKRVHAPPLRESLGIASGDRYGDLSTITPEVRTPLERARSVPAGTKGRPAADLVELAAGPWRAVVICAGSNDVVLGASAEATLPLVRALHAACDRHGVPVVVVPNPDCDMAHHGLCKDPARQRAELTKLAAMLADGAAAAGRAVADARAAMPMDAAHAHLWDDSIHPSPAGSRALAQAVHAAMRRHGL